MTQLSLNKDCKHLVRSGISMLKDFFPLDDEKIILLGKSSIIFSALCFK